MKKSTILFLVSLLLSSYFVFSPHAQAANCFVTISGDADPKEIKAGGEFKITGTVAQAGDDCKGFKGGVTTYVDGFDVNKQFPIDIAGKGQQSFNGTITLADLKSRNLDVSDGKTLSIMFIAHGFSNSSENVKSGIVNVAIGKVVKSGQGNNSDSSSTPGDKAPSAPSGTYLQNFPSIPGGPNPKDIKGLPDFIAYIYNLSFWIVGLCVFVNVLWGGFIIFFGAAGSASKVKQGQTKITNAVLGFLVLLSAYLILNVINPNLVKNSFNFNLGSSGNNSGGANNTSSAPGGIGAGAAGGTQKACGNESVNVCQGSGSCPANACPEFTAGIQKAAGGDKNQEALLRAIIYSESTCGKNLISNAGACGIVQLKPATANIYKGQCGVSQQITCDWLNSAANFDASICIANQYIKSLSSGGCGTDVRNIAAGYNGGPGACLPSRDCATEKSCDGQQAARRWECLYDNTAHTKCNTGFRESRNYAPKVLSCYTINGGK